MTSIYNARSKRWIISSLLLMIGAPRALNAISFGSQSTAKSVVLKDGIVTIKNPHNNTVSVILFEATPDVIATIGSHTDGDGSFLGPYGSKPVVLQKGQSSTVNVTYDPNKKIVAVVYPGTIPGLDDAISGFGIGYKASGNAATDYTKARGIGKKVASNMQCSGGTRACGATIAQGQVCCTREVTYYNNTGYISIMPVVQTSIGAGPGGGTVTIMSTGSGTNVTNVGGTTTGITGSTTGGTTGGITGGTTGTGIGTGIITGTGGTNGIGTGIGSTTGGTTGGTSITGDTTGTGSGGTTDTGGGVTGGGTGTGGGITGDTTGTGGGGTTGTGDGTTGTGTGTGGGTTTTTTTPSTSSCANPTTYISIPYNPVLHPNWAPPLDYLTFTEVAESPAIDNKTKNENKQWYKSCPSDQRYKILFRSAYNDRKRSPLYSLEPNTELVKHVDYIKKFKYAVLFVCDANNEMTLVDEFALTKDFFSAENTQKDKDGNTIQATGILSEVIYNYEGNRKVIYTATEDISGLKRTKYMIKGLNEQNYKNCKNLQTGT